MVSDSDAIVWFHERDLDYPETGVHATPSLSAREPSETQIRWFAELDRLLVFPTSGTLSNMTITLATGARIWKKTTSQDFSAVRVGDEISVRGHRVSQGELVATQVYVNITRITGRITNVNGNEFEVDIFDVSGKRRGETTTVIVDAQTVTGRDVSLSMSDLQKGRYVEIIGLKLPDGKIAATRVDVGQ